MVKRKLTEKQIKNIQKLLKEGQPGYQNAKDKLRKLIFEKEVELKNFVDIDYDRLVCDVYFDGKNLADYFPNYKE